MTVNCGDWSETPASNTTIDSINIAENCSPGNLNNAIRSLMAGVKTFKLLYDGLVTTVAGKLSASGAVFSGTQPTYSSEGAFLHHQSSTNTSGKIYLLPEGSADPSGTAAGDMVFFYTP